MLIGDMAEDGSFTANTSMARNLYWMVAVEKATASREVDRVREMNTIKSTCGFAAMDSLVKGALTGAGEIAFCPEVAATACGADSARSLLSFERMSPAKRDSAMIAAASGGYVRAIEMLLSAKAGVDTKAQACNETPLMLAARGGHVAAIRCLVNAGAGVNVATVPAGVTPLLLAAGGTHVRAILELLTSRADVNHADEAGRTALIHLAAQNRDDRDIVQASVSGRAPCQHTAIEILLDHRADVNVCERSGWSALMHLAAGGDVERIKLLFAYNASMKATDEGFTALMAAALGGHVEVLDFLRAQCNVDVLQRQQNGKTALSYAAHFGCDAAVAWLISAKADVNGTDLDGGTALMYACGEGHSKAVCQLLADHDVDTGLIDGNGDTALIRAAVAGHHEVCKLLLEANVDGDGCNRTGMTPLMVAAEMGHQRVVALLISASVEVNALDLDGMGALDYALQHRTSMTLARFERPGATCQEATNKTRSQPLVMLELEEEAADLNAAAVVQMLRDAGAVTSDVETDSDEESLTE